MQEINMPQKSKYILDSLFKAFSITAEDAFVYLCDMEYDVSRWSEKAVERFDLPGEYMSGAGDIWLEHIHPDDRDSYQSSIEKLFTGEETSHDMQYRACGKDKKYVMCSCKGVVINNLKGEPMYFGGVIRNHEIMSSVDSLTGLSNHYRFIDHIKTVLLNEKPVSILMVGIGHFSEINDVYGYDFGNKILQRVARDLYKFIGNRGYLYRLDGPKFGIISKTIDMNEFESAFKKSIRFGAVIDNVRINAAGVGGALNLDTFNINAKTVMACLNYAYEISKYKKQGKLAVFTNKISDEDSLRLEILNDVRNCVNDRCKGFELFYQPIMDAHTEKLHGAEALIRWRSDKYGLVFPDMFVPVLENDAIFPRLGEWILRQGMKQGKKILQNHPDFVLNINLSYSQLEQDDFVQVVLDAIRDEEFPSQNLCLEVTERCRMVEIERLQNIFDELHANDIRLALDDFGTGFSSAEILKELRFDTIKIDRAFVRNIANDTKEQKLVEGFVNIASIFGSDVCVEGIEDDIMKEILKNYQVDTLQGYLFSKPIPFEEFEDKYSQNSN